MTDTTPQNPQPTTPPLTPADIPPGTAKTIHVNETPVCLANHNGTIYAVSDSCTHAQISLDGSPLEGRQIICPWHGAMFDLKTGRATCGPATDPLTSYPIHINPKTNQIEIDTQNPNPDPNHD